MKLAADAAQSTIAAYLTNLHNRDLRVQLPRRNGLRR